MHRDLLLTPNISRESLILLVEDHPVNQQVAQLYLNEMALACHIVNNGMEATEAVKRTDYTLVLMDCQMPEMDGFEATRTIRKAEELTGGHTPIIAMTANAMAGDKEQCLAAGMDDYISKPVHPDELQSRPPEVAARGVAATKGGKRDSRNASHYRQYRKDRLQC